LRRSFVPRSLSGYIPKGRTGSPTRYQKSLRIFSMKTFQTLRHDLADCGNAMAPAGPSIARSEIQIGFVRSTPDALSLNHAVVSHLLQIVFDARR
jgi:hypothetical protein